MSTAAQQADSAKVTAREAEITGKPPRIGPLDGGDKQQALDEGNALRKSIGLPPIDYITDYSATMMRHPTLNAKHTELALQIFNGTLAPRDRELAVLRTAWLCQAPYEWGEHVKIGKRVGGLTDVEIERVRQGSTAPGWNEDDRAILRAAEELREKAMISNATWAVLARRLNDKQLIELPIMIGQYQGVAYLQNSLRIRLLPDNPGLSAR